MIAFIVWGDPVSQTFPFLLATPVDKMIMLPRQSWFNPIKNHMGFREALKEYLKDYKLPDGY
jgi:hypothetical protein